MLNCNGLPGTHASCAEYCSDPALYDDATRNNKCYSVDQFDWLRAKLDYANQNNLDNIFVFAHAPLLTSGENHGATIGSEQIRNLLESNNVDIYFNGHNHAYERTIKVNGDSANENGTAYITTGVAGALTDTSTGDWFTAASYRDWTANYANVEEMASYTIVTVDESGISGIVKSLGVTDPTDVVDSFTMAGVPTEDLIFENSFEASMSQ